MPALNTEGQHVSKYLWSVLAVRPTFETISFMSFTFNDKKEISTFIIHMKQWNSEKILFDVCLFFLSSHD